MTLTITFVTDPAVAPCVCCGQEGRVFIARSEPSFGGMFCNACSLAYLLQTVKNNGVELREIQESFVKLSAALDAPVASSLVQ